MNADFQPSAALRGGVGPVAVQHPNEVCVSFSVRITAFNVCSTVDVDKKLGFERRRRGKARCLAITAKGFALPPRPADTERFRKGAAPLRGHCDAGQEKESGRMVEEASTLSPGDSELAGVSPAVSAQS